MKTIFRFLIANSFLLPAFLYAQNQIPKLKEGEVAQLSWPTPKPMLEGRDHIYSAEIDKIKRVRLSFDIYKFFENLDLALEKDEEVPDDENVAKKWKEDYQKLQELGYSRGEAFDLIRDKWVCKRGSFGFAWIGRSIYVIDLKKPTEAIVLLTGSYGRDARPSGERGKFANGVDGIEIEKIGDDTYRIFAQGLGGTMKFGFSPKTEVWDYKLKKDTIVYCDFGQSFAKDLEKNGHRNIVVYEEEFQGEGGKGHWKLSSLGVFSWNGKEWLNINGREKGFLDELAKVFPAHAL